MFNPISKQPKHKNIFAKKYASCKGKSKKAVEARRVINNLKVIESQKRKRHKTIFNITTDVMADYRKNGIQIGPKTFEEIRLKVKQIIKDKFGWEAK